MANDLANALANDLANNIVKNREHSLEIREAQAGDIEGWVTLRQALWPRSEAAMLYREARAILEDTGQAAFLLVSQSTPSEPLGFIEGAVHHGPDGPYGHVEGWYVTPETRGEGWGRELLEALEGWFLHRSIGLLTSDTTPEFPRSPAAHHRAGFRQLHQFTIFIRDREGSDVSGATEACPLSDTLQAPEGSILTAERCAAEVRVLQQFVTPRRWERMQAVLAARTRYITAVVEDIYQPHNGSAVLRSCDAFGVQDVHIIENRNRYRINPSVELGTSQWLTIHRYHHPDPTNPTRATEQCIAALRTAGYRIVATTPHRDDVTPGEIDLNGGPIALLFGTEKEGLTDTALAAADEYLRIPMVGFVESLNISVSAAVTLQTLTERLRGGGGWQLPEHEQLQILRNWLHGSVRHSAQIIARELD